MAVGYTTLKGFIGVNLTDPASELADNELAWARNCWSEKRGYIEPRPLQDTIGEVITTVAPDSLDDAARTGLYPFVDAGGAYQIVTMLACSSANALDGFYFVRAGNWDTSLLQGIIRHDAVGTPPVGVAAFDFQCGVTRPVPLVYNNELYLFLGHTVPGLIFGKNDYTSGPGVVSTASTPKFRELGAQGTGWTTGAGTTGDRYKFSFGDVYRGVFMLGGLPPPFESLLAFTQPGDTPNTLLSTAKWVGIGFGDGDRLLRAIATPVTGGAAAVEPYALALKRRSVWLVQGQTPSTTDNGTLVVTPVLKREGLIAPHAVCHTPYGIAWCSGQNVWLMPPGTEPKTIGDKIKGFISKMPQAPVESWFMEFHNDTLYLNFPSPWGLSVGREVGTGARTYAPTQQLWCDLRNPDEPRWWGPQDVRSVHQVSTHLQDGTKQMLGLTAYQVGSTNTKYQPYQLVASTAKSRDLNDSGIITQDGIQPPASGWQHIKFKELSFGDDSLEKIIEGMEVVCIWDLGLGTNNFPDADNDVPFSPFWLKNGGQGALNNPVSPVIVARRGSGNLGVGDPSAVGFTLDVNVLDSTGSPTGLDQNLAESFIPVMVFPYNGARYRARLLQPGIWSMRVIEAGFSTADQIIVRRLTVKSVTLRIRPIGRRPGGSYGG